MKTWVRKLRGIAGMGALWGTLGAVFGLLLGGADAVCCFGPIKPILPEMIRIGSEIGLLGFLAGSSFAVVVAAVDGRRTWEQLSIPRIMMWGFLAGTAVPSLYLSLLYGPSSFLYIVGQMQLDFLAESLGWGVVPGGVGAAALLVARRGSNRVTHTAEAPLLAAPTRE